MSYPNINAERSRMGLTIEELAEKLGVTRKTVYNGSREHSPVKA